MRRVRPPLQIDSRRPEIEAQRPRHAAALARSRAALEIVAELEHRLAGDPTYPTFDRRHRQAATEEHRRRSDR